MIEALERCRELRDVAAPGNPFRLACTLEPPTDAREIEAAWPDRRLPASLVEAWATCRSARLFEDVEYGQWGLVLLDPAGSAERTERERRDRPDDLAASDVVVGEFLGDSDLLVVAAEPSPAVLVALPLDPRADWPVVAPDLDAFFRAYVDALGAKFWAAGTEHA